MTRNEIIERIIGLLREHKENQRGSIHQEPYKRDFFELFAEAYNAGMMSGRNNDVLYADTLAVSLADRSPELVEGQTWDALYQFWSEWTYAWRHSAQRREHV
jgi:hypothetical protein